MASHTQQPRTLRNHNCGRLRVHQHRYCHYLRDNKLSTQGLALAAEGFVTLPCLLALVEQLLLELGADFSCTFTLERRLLLLARCLVELCRNTRVNTCAETRASQHVTGGGLLTIQVKIQQAF